MTINLDFEKLRALFPLTPALSLGERGKRSPFLGGAVNGFGSMTFGFYKTIQRLFPLPAGEGQGEGIGRRKGHGVARVVENLRSGEIKNSMPKNLQLVNHLAIPGCSHE
jgi:hypothetical protein